MSLREQNKARTRDAIRAAALDLITRQGYQATTVAQIAEAAKVSHTTFFRYFDTKEQVIIADPLDGGFAQMLAAIPPGLDRFDLIRHILSAIVDSGARDPWVSNVQRAELVRNEPALRLAHQTKLDRVITEMRDFVAQYCGVSPDSFRLRVFLFALAGAVAHIAESKTAINDATLDELLSAVDLMEQGLPL